jgi:hypothetical protein
VCDAGPRVHGQALKPEVWPPTNVFAWTSKAEAMAPSRRGRMRRAARLVSHQPHWESVTHAP